MSDDGQQVEDVRTRLDAEALCRWIGEQRWYASKSRGITGAEVAEAADLGDGLYLTLVQARTSTGSQEIYQLLLEGVAASAQDAAADCEIVPVDAVAQEPIRALALLQRMLTDADIETSQGCFTFRHVPGAYAAQTQASARAMGAQQSNSSLVIDEHVALKLFRRVESGINPELEMLRFLTSRNFEHIAPLQGWYEYEGRSLASTLGVAQTFVTDGADGWEMALDQLLSAPDELLDALASLGRVTAQMHTTLASDAGDPAFSPEDPINESMSLLTASIDDDIQQIFMRLPDDEATAPIYGRGDDVRARLTERSQIVAGGKNIRTHGDFHLGQTLRTADSWIILDFEGEPGRPLADRRHKSSPLRDVAGMLRSLAYLTSAAEMQRGGTVPEGFEQRARSAFLDAYFTEVDPALLPGSQVAVINLLAIFELEKAIYELRYELNNRPDWVEIPAAAIERLVDQE